MRKRSQFLRARRGVTERQRSLVVQAIMRGDDKPHIGEGFTATKKIGNSVTRNRAKRRLREASRQILPQFGLAGADYVFIARAATSTVTWQRLLDDMETALISLAGRLGDSSETT